MTKNIVPTNLNEVKTSIDSWRSTFSNTFKQLVDKGKELQQVTEQFFSPQVTRDFPRLDIAEGPNEIFVVFELPGLTKEEFSLEIGGGLLYLKGEKKNSLQNKAVGVHLSECSYGKFERTVSLPIRIIEEKVQAEFNAGVLIVTIPKSESQSHIRIPVKIK